MKRVDGDAFAAGSRCFRVVAVSIVVGLFVIGCGGEAPADDNQQQHDEMDAGVDDVGDDDTGEVSDDPDAGEDTDSGEPDDVGPDVDPPDDAPFAFDDYLVCESDLDCPINGSECVVDVPFNRIDADETEEVAIADLFDEVDEGEGVCTRTCSDDPTACEAVVWSDQAGQPRESSCQVVATGAKPYEINEALAPENDGDEPVFDVDLDFEEMEQGQAFGAICRPAIEYSGGRSESFCAHCDVPEQCDDDSLCFNALTEAPRDSADELGDSFCVEECSDEADCPMGFACRTVDLSDESGDYCLPVHDTCTDCIDRDEDGYGTGNCGDDGEYQTPYDCDDTNPDAYYDADAMAHPFPDHCYDDPEAGGYFNDLNCSGVLDHVEQIGSEDWGAYHCTACNDSCSGPVDEDATDPDAYNVCQTDDAGAPYCGVGCEPGFARCGAPLEDGCPIDIAAEKAEGEDKLYRDAESDYIWYEADEDEEWATADAEPQFFCDADEAAAVLDHPTQRRGCHDEEPGAHPGAQQLCDDIDWNCNGETGPTDPATEDETAFGQLVTAGEYCEHGDGMCTDGLGACTEDYQMVCEPDFDESTYPADPPYCSGEDTTCDGNPDNSDVDDGDLFRVGDDDPITDVGATVAIGDDCVDPDALGECAYGAASCSDAGLSCETAHTPEPEPFGFDGVDNSCDGYQRHVDSTGSIHFVRVDSSIGSPSLSQAIELAADPGGNPHCGQHADFPDLPCDVFVERGVELSETETIELREGVNVYGGFDSQDLNDLAAFVPGDDPPTLGTPSPAVASEVVVHAEIGMYGKDIQEPTEISGLTIQTADLDVEQCIPNIGTYCDSCDGLRMSDVTIQSGTAGDGTDGSNGSHGQSAPSNEGDGGPEGGIIIGMGASAEGGHGYPHDGGNSGRTSGESGQDGQPGSPHGGAGGNGDTGGDGSHGVPPSAPQAPDEWHDMSLELGSELGLDVDCPASSEVAVSETAHGGGGGGTYAFEPDCLNPPCGDFLPYGAGGGGGGEAGEPGGNGTAGAPSIGMIVTHTTDAVFDNVQIIGGPGGQGGNGGNGGNGGSGADGATSDTPVYGDEPDLSRFTMEGGDGAGGAGGPSGAGGHGGPSIGMLLYQADEVTDSGWLTVSSDEFVDNSGNPGASVGSHGGDQSIQSESGESGETFNCDMFSVPDTDFSVDDMIGAGSC